MIENLKKHYQDLYKMHGDSPASVQHIDRESQFHRFNILTEQIKENESIIDLGCGLGDMAEFLESEGFNGNYLGLDFIPEFIERAQQRFGHNPKVLFKEFDINSSAIPTGYDFVLLSGVFNNKIQNNDEFMYEALEKMFSSCKKGIVFNALSTFVDFQDPELFYTNPLEIFEFCRTNLSLFVSLKHDYITKPGGYPYEYTISVLKDPV